MDISQSHVGTSSDGFGYRIAPTTTVTNSTVEEILTGHLQARHATIGSSSSETAVLDNSVMTDCPWVNATRAGEGNWSPLGCDIEGSGKVQGADPLLGPLQGNGFETWSRIPLAGSPLIDAADPSRALPADQQVARAVTVAPSRGRGDRREALEASVT